MKKLTVFFVLLSTILLIPIHSHAFAKLAQAGFKFLDIGIGARPAAMGEAFVVVGNDANAIFYNPAGLAQVDSKFDFSVSVTKWIADISYNAAGLVINAGNWGNFGVSVISPDYGAVTGTRVAPTEKGFEETGQLDVGAFALGFSYGRQLTDKFRVGGQIKYTSQHLGSNEVVGPEEALETSENKLSTLAYDFGTIFYPRFGGFESFGFGMSIRNFSPEVKYLEAGFQLPLTYTLGFAMDILDFFGEHPDNSFVVDIDAVHPRDYTERLHVGGEFWYKNMLALRGGYKFNYDEEGITLGVGINAGGIKLDYAYSEFGVFDVVNRVSLGMSF
mgnify:CR=1 FL=1